METKVGQVVWTKQPGKQGARVEEAALVIKRNVFDYITGQQGKRVAFVPAY